MCIRKPKKVSKTMSRKSTSFLEERIASRDSKQEAVCPSVAPVKEGKRGSGQNIVAKSKKDIKEVPEKEVRSTPESRSSVKKDRKSKENNDSCGLIACESILSEMEAHDDAWPFKTPVNTKQFPTYKKIIKKPMDLQSMRQKLESGV